MDIKKYNHLEKHILKNPKFNSFYESKDYLENVKNLIDLNIIRCLYLHETHGEIERELKIDLCNKSRIHYNLLIKHIKFIKKMRKKITNIYINELLIKYFCDDISLLINSYL